MCREKWLWRKIGQQHFGSGDCYLTEGDEGICSTSCDEPRLDCGWIIFFFFLFLFLMYKFILVTIQQDPLKRRQDMYSEDMHRQKTTEIKRKLFVCVDLIVWRGKTMERAMVGASRAGTVSKDFGSESYTLCEPRVMSTWKIQWKRGMTERITLSIMSVGNLQWGRRVRELHLGCSIIKKNHLI
jgi:hypothetical protein